MEKPTQVPSRRKLFYDGKIRLSYLRMDARHGVVGLSDGHGAADSMAASDFSAYPRKAGAGVVDHLVWGSVLSPQGAGEPFKVSIAAYDSLNNPLTNFPAVYVAGIVTGTVVSPVTVKPTIVSNASSGEWSGILTVLPVVAGMQLAASDGAGHQAFSGVFDTMASTPRVLSARLSGTNLLVTWPAPASTYVLESAESLNPPVWSPVGITPILSGSVMIVTNPASASQKYFRLSR